MDALSSVLNSVRFEGALCIDAEFTAPWAMRGCYGTASVKQRLRGAEHVVYFHFLTEGACQVKVDGHEVLEASAGDMVLFPQDDSHLMGSHLQMAPLETENLNDADAHGGFIRVRHGGGGTATKFVCGYLACNRALCRPLLDALPRVLRIPIGDGVASSLLRELMRAGVQESSATRPGGQSMLAKLADLMVVEALRRYCEDLPPGVSGWLAAVRDASVGRALALLHDEPTRAWTVDELARAVALSRSGLAERFSALVGEPPMQYLMRWRLALAARTLRSGNEALARVAERCGYESQAAFNRAFKREFGMPPAAWRRSAAA